MVPWGLRGEELLGLLEGGELVSYQEGSPEVIVADVAGGGRGSEDVGLPVGRRLGQDSGN